MEKILKILAVLALLMLVIVFTINARERKFREYFFLKRIKMLPDGGSPSLGSTGPRSVTPSAGRQDWNPDLTLLLVYIKREGEEGDKGGQEIAAADKENQLFFSVAGGKEIVVTDQTIQGTPHETITTIPLDDNIDGILFDPATRLLYCCSAEGGLTILRQHSRTAYKMLQRLSIPVNCNAFALDPKTGGLYIYAEGSAFIFTQS